MRKIGLVLFCIIYANIAFAQAVLNADGEGGTYELINSVLAPNGDVVEVPDCSHAEFGRHIDEVYDSELETYVFRFHMHVTPDNDRCKNFDRQRNEIKTYDQSPDSLLGIVGEKHELKWKYKLDSNFQSSSSFTHIHQLKAVGGPHDGMPLITLTTRKGSPDKLELRYAAETSQSTLKKVDLDPFKGTWVQAVETITFGDPGEYSITLTKIDTGEELFSYSSTTRKMYKTDADFIRPKWGLYRSLNDSGNLRDEIVLFADFYIKETIIPDEVKPTVELASEATQPVSEKFSVNIAFSEEVTGFAEEDIVIVNGEVEAGSLASSDNINFTVNIIPESTGNVSINVGAGVATDLAGNENEAANELIVVAEIVTIGFEETENNFQIYPNPSTGNLSVLVNAIGDYQIALIDTFGRECYLQKHDSEKVQLDLTDFAKGVYIIQVRESENVYSEKFLLK